VLHRFKKENFTVCGLLWEGIAAVWSWSMWPFSHNILLPNE